MFYMIIVVLISAYSPSFCEWNMVYEHQKSLQQWDLDCADSLNCISVSTPGTTGSMYIRTTDGGYNWFVQLADTTVLIYDEEGQWIGAELPKYNPVRCVDFVTPDFIVVGHKGGQITISRDGGLTWVVVSLNASQDLKIIKFTDSLSGIALTNNLLFLTIDGGVNWEHITNNINNSGVIYFGSAFMKDDFIYAGDFFSTDKGITWTRSYPVNNVERIHGVYFIDKNEGWCLGIQEQSDVILHTTNSGLEWVTQLDTIFEPDFPLTGGVHFSNKNEGLAYGKGGKIWRTTDGGKNWNLDKSFPFSQNNHFTKLVCPAGHTNKLLASILSLGEIWMYEELPSSIESEINVNNVNIFPNPAGDYITIQLSNNGLQPFATGDKVEIFDVLGIEVMSVGIGLDLSAQRIDISHLTVGVYFIRIGDKVEKFVKM